MKKVRKKKRKLTLPFSMIQEKIGMRTKIEMEIIMVENVECSSFFYTTSLTFLSFYSILFYSSSFLFSTLSDIPFRFIYQELDFFNLNFY